MGVPPSKKKSANNCNFEKCIIIESVCVINTHVCLQYKVYQLVFLSVLYQFVTCKNPTDCERNPSLLS